MTIPEEIEELKIKLEQTADEKEQVEVLMAILKKYSSINSTDSQPYIDRLLHLAGKQNLPLFKAWGLFFLAFLRYCKGENRVSLNLSQEAIAIFEQINEIKGIAASYGHIGNVYCRLGSYPEAIKNHYAELKLQKEIGDKSGIAFSLNNIGNVYNEIGDYSEAIKNHFSALKLREEIRDQSGIGASYNNIGIIYLNQGNYPEALNFFLQSIHVKEKIADNRGIALSYNNLGEVQRFRGDYTDALKSYFMALEILKEIEDKHLIASIYNNTGNIYGAQGDFQKALKSHLSSLQLSEEISDKHGIATSYNNLGNIYGIQGNHSEALIKFSLSLRIREEIGDKQGTASSYYSIAEVHYYQGNYPDALKTQLLALQLSEEISDKDNIKDSCLSLANIYKMTGDFESALKYYERYHEVEKEILGAESSKQLNNLNFMHNLDRKEKDLEIEQLRNVELKKERDLSDALLLNILPAEVAEELKNKGTADPKLFDDVTVLYTDFKSFTKVSEKLSPQQLVDELNVCFSAFDEIAGRYNIERIKTIGDAYMAVSGLPIANPNHACDVINAAIEIREFIKERVNLLGDNTFGIRIGVNSGSVVAGIVGVKKYAYDIWGDTVNIAARMEQSSETGKINISESTYQLVKENFNCEYRGEIEAKNKGKLKMYFVE